MSTNFGVNFNGRRVIHPGAYNYSDASSMVVTTNGSSNLPIVIGQADSGEPGVVKWFTSAEDAKAYFGSGELVTALQMMFSPAPEGGGGASIVGTLVANTNTKATATVGGMVISSLPYGQIGNKIQAKMQNDTISGAKQFVVTKWDTNTIETYTNVGAILKIAYTGASPYAAITVTQDGSKKAITLQTKVGADVGSAVVDVNIDLTNSKYATVDDVFRYIASLSNYTISYVNYDSAGISASALDTLTAVSITGTGNYVMSVAGDLAYRVNKYSSLVNVNVTGVLANFGYTYLTGGTSGTIPASWSSLFDIVTKQFSDMLVVLSDSMAIQAEALAHIAQMEQRNQKQLLFTGGAVGETIQQVKQRAAMLNSSRAVVAYPGVKYQPAGDTVLPAYMTAAMLAGRVAGVSPSEPITFDYFNIISLENDLLAGDPTVDDLLSSGVSTLERVQNGGIRLAQGITTYLGTPNTLYREISVQRGADKVSEDVRLGLETAFVGKKDVQATPTALITKTKDILDQSVRNGDIVSYDPKSITVSQVGTIMYVDYEVAPIEPINFILVTTHFVPTIIL